MSEPVIQPDRPYRSNGRLPLSAMIPIALSVIMALASVGAVWKSVVTQESLDRFKAEFQQAYYAPMSKRVESLESYRESVGEKLGKLNVLEVRLAALETSLTESKNMVRDATLELKAMIRDLSIKFERRSQEPIRPQHGAPWEWDWYYPELQLARPAAPEDQT